MQIVCHPHLILHAITITFGAVFELAIGKFPVFRNVDADTKSYSLAFSPVFGEVASLTFATSLFINARISSRSIF